MTALRSLPRLAPFPVSTSLSVAASLVSNSQLVGETANAVLSFRTTNPVPPGGRVALSFPERWNPTAPPSDQLSYFVVSVSCQGLENIAPSASCSLSGDTLTLVDGFP